jgi:hypothetical protein
MTGWFFVFVPAPVSDYGRNDQEIHQEGKIGPPNKLGWKLYHAGAGPVSPSMELGLGLYCHGIFPL